MPIPAVIAGIGAAIAAFAPRIIPAVVSVGTKVAPYLTKAGSALGGLLTKGGSTIMSTVTKSPFWLGTMAGSIATSVGPSVIGAATDSGTSSRGGTGSMDWLGSLFNALPMLLIMLLLFRATRGVRVSSGLF